MFQAFYFTWVDPQAMHQFLLGAKLLMTTMCQDLQGPGCLGDHVAIGCKGPSYRATTGSAWSLDTNIMRSLEELIPSTC